jgi:hypothetical protein
MSFNTIRFMSILFGLYSLDTLECVLLQHHLSVDFDSNPAKVFVRGDYTKTRFVGTIFLTEEVTHNN